MDFFARDINEDSILRCPFLRNINEPTNFSFVSPLAFPMPVSFPFGLHDSLIIFYFSLHIWMFLPLSSYLRMMPVISLLINLRSMYRVRPKSDYCKLKLLFWETNCVFFPLYVPVT